MHLGHFALGIRLRDLRIERHLKITHELLDSSLHLHRHTTGGIDHWTKEDVEQDVEPLSKQHCRQIAEHAPPGKTCHLLEQRTVPGMTIFCFFKVFPAICPITNLYEYLNQHQQECIEYQFVKREDYQYIHDGQPQHNLQYGHIGKGRHLLVCYDAGIIGYTDNHDERSDDGGLQYPECSVHPVGRYLQLVVQKPEADCFAQDDDQSCYEHMYLQRSAEHGMELVLVSFAQSKSDVTLCGR